MKEKEKFIQEVHRAIWEEIQEYVYAHNTSNGLLEHLQGYKWLFDKRLCEKYYGQGAHFFDVFDTQEHLDEFIKAKKLE